MSLNIEQQNLGNSQQQRPHSFLFSWIGGGGLEFFSRERGVGGFCFCFNVIGGTPVSKDTYLYIAVYMFSVSSFVQHAAMHEGCLCPRRDTLQSRAFLQKHLVLLQVSKYGGKKNNQPTKTQTHHKQTKKLHKFKCIRKIFLL